MNLSMLQKRYEVDQNPFDGWTLVHAGYGMAAGLVGVPVLITLGAALLWEAVENCKRPATTFDSIPSWTPEVNANILVDIIVAIGGWGVGALIAGAAR